MSAISRIAVAVLFFTTLFTLACGGGSGSDSGTFPPVFVVPNPGSASEGAPFSYTLQADDPQGGSVTYALVSGPTGATLTGATINWTPTHAQSRQPNTFTVKAMSRSGASATTSFSVTPAGTIHGTDIITYWSANGAVKEPVNLSHYTVEALVPDSSGGTTAIAGQGASDGTFTIPNVPAGNYWLLAPAPPTGLPFSLPLATMLYRTDANDIDLGRDAAGRPNAMFEIPPVISTNPPNFTADLNLTGLDPWPWLSSDNAAFNFIGPLSGSLIGVSVNAGSQIGFTLPEMANGDTSILAQAVPVTILSPIDPSQGDTTYLLEYKESLNFEPGPVDSTYALTEIRTLSKALGPLSITVDSTTPALDFSGEFSAPNPGTLAAKVKAAGFVSSVKGTNPSAQAMGGFMAEATYVPVTERYTGTPGMTRAVFAYPTPGAVLASIYSLQGISADADLGTVAYSNPFSATATPIYSAQQASEVELATVSSGTTRASLGILGTSGYSTTTPPSADKPFDLPMGNVQNPQINGTSLFQTTSLTFPVTLSWSAPVGLVPSGYSVTIQGYDPNLCNPIPLPGGATPVCLPSAVSLTQLLTADSSIIVPGALFQSGLKYTFTIRALSDAGTNFRTAPNRGSWNRAYSDVVSNLITLGTAPAPASTAALQANTANTSNRSKRVLVIRDGDGTFRTFTCSGEGGTHCSQ